MIEEISRAKLLDRKDEQVGIWLNIQPRRHLRHDALMRPSTFLKQVDDTGRCRIEQVNPVIPRVIHEHLLVERMLEET